MKAILKKYLEEGGSFLEGLQLYVQLGAGPELTELERISKKAFLAEGDRSKLENALKAIYDRLPDISDIPSLQAPISVPVIEQRTIPAVIQKLKEEGKKLKKRESFVHALMVEEAHGAQDQKKLFQFAKELMLEIQPALNEVYGQIKAWEQDGTLPPDEVAKIQTQAIRDYKRLQNKKTRIYRLKSLLKKPDLSKEDREKHKAEIIEKEKEIEEISKLLNVN